MKKINRLDILYITISITILLISFLLNGFYKSYQIKNIFEIGLLNVTDIYSLTFFPLLILLFLFGKYRITLALSYSMTLALYGFFIFTPMEFQYDTLLTVSFLIICFLYIIGIYFLSNLKHAWINKLVKDKYFKIGYYLMYVIAFFMSTWEEGKISQLIFGFILLVGLLCVLYNQQRWSLNFVIILLLCLVLATFYLGCYSQGSGDIVYINFSIRNIIENCLNNYLWIISNFLILYITVNKINTPPNTR